MWINPDHDDLLHDVGPPVLVQQGDVQDEDARSLAAGGHLRLHPCTDRRVSDGVDALAGGGVRKDGGRKLAPIETAIRQQDVRAEGVDDLLERGLTGLNDVARQPIRIDHLGAQLHEHLGDHGLAGTDPTGEAQGSHRP